VKRANVVPDESIREPLAVDYPSGACLIARSEAIDDVGLLDERYFMYAEETDWCLRMKEMEWERYYVPQAEIVHRCAGSPGSSSDRVNLVFLESLFAYYRKNFTPRQLWAVSAGYILRSFCSWIYWLVATALRPESGSSHTRARMIYWRRSLELAAAALADLFRGEIGKKQVQAPARSSS
jgi:GT2 family glycosyltransferase